MPLVVLCGLPGSGKTVIAQALVKYIQDTGNEQVVYIMDETVHMNKLDGYKDPQTEKLSRRALKSAVELALNANTIVVLDALNYIKGQRYELFCLAKTESTTYCVIYADIPLSTAIERKVREDEGFDIDLLKKLADRFEVPDAKKRWDNPLYHISTVQNEQSIDLHSVDIDTSYIPLKDIAIYLREGKTMKAGQATAKAPIVESSFHQQLEILTNKVVEFIVSRQQDDVIVNSVIMPGATKILLLTRTFPTAELRRHRRQFVKIASHSPDPKFEIVDQFIDFLNQKC